MSTYRLLILAISISLLSACSDKEKIASLEAQNSKLSKENIQLGVDYEKILAANSDMALKIQNEYAIRMFELEKQRIAAAITQACKQPFNINVCPESVTAAGEISIKNGVSGGDRLLFWLPYSLKMLSLILILFLSSMIGFRIWSRKFKPIFVAVKDAKKFLAEADQRVLDIDNLLAARKKGLDTTNAKIQHQEQVFDTNAAGFENQLNVFEEEIKNKKQVLVDLDAQQKSKQAALDALQSFKF